MIHVTESAGREIARLAQEKDAGEKGGLRLFVQGGGCAGMSYGMDIVEKSDEKDRVFEIDGARIIVDPKSWLFLNGTTVDFKESLMGRGFVFENPNAAGSCGCGTSFSMQEQPQGSETSKSND
ncbi:MAG: iron-sulfur cluster assembly accessory protein [Planctomycetota bacterium]|nr:MAG: iron-sulfur cluster assembly accessory protein [Planctomycetota bacterium]HIC21928.1 iron-sulfur cluster assembly accessory protein [Planctomycetota bacterium]